MSRPIETESKPKQPRRLGRRILTWIGVAAGLLVLLVAASMFYTTTDDFGRRVGGKVVSILDDATGGRTEIGHLSFNPWHLAIEVDDLVIHGKEPAGELPYLSVKRLLVNVKINTFVHRSEGQAAPSRIGLNYLRVEQPRFHLIVDKDGNTNQPTPKHPSASTEPIQDTLLDLQARRVELADGLVVLNDKPIPFDVAANELNLGMKWISSTDHYAITLNLADLRTKLDKQPEVQSKLDMTAELGRDMAQLTRFDFATGSPGPTGLVTHLNASASIKDFARPEWDATVHGGIDLKQLSMLADVDGLNGGTLDLDVRGHNCVVTPQVAQKRPRFWQRHRNTAPSAKLLAPDPECKAGYLLVGQVKMHNAGYRNEYVRLHDINGGAQLQITPSELLFTALTGYLPGGGSAEGQLKIENWLGEVPANTPASATAVAAVTTTNTTAKGIGAAAPIKPSAPTQVNRAHAYLTVTVNKIPLRTIMDVTAPEHYGDLGFDTAITGPVEVEWGGPATAISESVQVQAALQLAPTGAVRSRALANIPVNGKVLAHYDGRTEVVNIQQVVFQTPATTLSSNGVLGVSDGDPLTNLQVNLQARDLGEFDQLLQTLGFEANGKKGSAAIPVVLHGTMDFAGTARGMVRDLDVKGHLTADNLAVQLGTEADVHIDSVVADAEYSPYAGLAVASSTVRRSSAVLNVTGSFKPHKVLVKKVVEYNWDDDVAMDITAKLGQAQAADLLQIAGQQNNIPLTGVVSLDAHAKGTVHDLNGAGNVTLTNGVAYGEPYQSVTVDVAAQGYEVSATKVALRAHDATVTGSGTYNLDTKRIRAQIASDGLQLSKFERFNRLSTDADGLLAFNATVDGTLEQPGLNAKLSLTNVIADGEPVGELNASATSSGSTVSYQVNSTLIGTQVAVVGRTELTGDYQTQAKLTLSGLDIANGLALFAPNSIKGSSNIAGTVMVNGPLSKPQQLAGTAEFQNLDVKLQSVELKSVEPLRASLSNGTLKLEQVHITGLDTDLQASGTVQVLGDTNAMGGALNLNASGKVNTGLAHSFDPDLITSGEVSFTMAAGGRMKKPELTGDVQLQNVNLAIDGVANGLSNMNGTLEFNEERLDVKNLTATTGGGQLKIGGYLAYQKGLFADLSATGDAVRVRLNGLSTTATANVRLQGTPQSMLLSGNVLVTRFGVGPDVDFAAFATTGPSIPPAPDALTNKIRMDVRVTSAPQLDFQNSYAKLAGSVDLTVRGTVAVPSILGRIQITEGKATFNGTNYELTRGSITFSNPVRIDPVIDLDAQARVETYDITIGLHGTTASLHPTYRSQPPLTETDIFNLLALGRTQEESQIYQQQQSQAGSDSTTNAVLGGALNATVSSRVNKLFGAGSVKIDPTYVGTLGNSSARITVVEPISKQVTLTFATNVNQTAQQLIQVQYQINQNTALVLGRDENGVFSIVYKIRKQYR